MNLRSIDIYLTYRCNLRCRHCFVGDHLDSARDFDSELLCRLIDSCVAWRTKEITFLGGEPTLYPDLIGVVERVQERNISARIVTNGLTGLRRFVRQAHGPIKPTIGVSLDGSIAEVHDAVRGKNSFERTVRNIIECKERGFPVFGITSISRQNVDDVRGILALSRRLGLDYLNIHYVVAVGFADSSLVLPPELWHSACGIIRHEAARLGVEVRVEELVRRHASQQDLCAVRNSDNLMFLPDGRVFSCPLFMNLPNSHSYVWTRNGLSVNAIGTSERAICELHKTVACPAMSLIDPGLTAALEDGGFKTGCVLAKASYGPNDRQLTPSLGNGHSVESRAVI